MPYPPLFLKGSRLVGFLLRLQNFTEIELRKNEIENAAGGEEECVYRGLVVLSVGLCDKRKKATEGWLLEVVALKT